MTGRDVEMEVTRSQSRRKWRRTGTNALLLAILVFGLAGLVYAVARGLYSGREFDLHRRWVVGQYALAGVNPYPLARAALEEVHGVLGSGRPKPCVYAIPRLDAANPTVGPGSSRLLAAYGTPEAVYPPSSDLLMSLLSAALPQEWVHPAGMSANLCLLAALALLLRREVARPGSLTSLAAISALLLAWSPTLLTIEAGQFSVLVSLCLLATYRCLDRNEYLAGALLALALLKPPIALPFLILPLLRRRWRALSVALALHFAAVLTQSLRFGIAPWTLLEQWLGVAAYFAQGQFTLFEVLSALGLAHSFFGQAAAALFVFFVLIWCSANRAASAATIFDLLCVVSCLWTFHYAYDFTILIVPLARRLVPVFDPASESRAHDRFAGVAAATFLTLSLAASPLVYGDEVHVAARIVRHGARLLLALELVVSLIAVLQSARSIRSELTTITIGLPVGRQRAPERRLRTAEAGGGRCDSSISSASVVSAMTG